MRDRPRSRSGSSSAKVCDGCRWLRSRATATRGSQLAATHVVFYTAHYHEREARNLAEHLGVARILLLAHSLRMHVIAEGVESEEQAKILRLLRCDQMQGYLISKPVTFDEMTAKLTRTRP